MDWAFEYVKLNGVANGNEYIYTGKDETCKQSYKRDKKITGYKDLGSCSDITTLIATAAVSVAVDASRWSLYGIKFKFILKVVESSVIVMLT